MMDQNSNKLQPHRRYNPLTGEWLLLSPHRTQRPWQGKTEEAAINRTLTYDPKCYLCPGNTRMGGQQNADYTTTFVFDNDFKALKECERPFHEDEDGLFRSESTNGTCRVICFSRNHNLTLAQMEEEDLLPVIDVWKAQMAQLSNDYRWVQIFENKGEVMGCSNPHPHGQIWASDYIPEEPAKEDRCQKAYLDQHGKNLLVEYLTREKDKRERIVAENDQWLCVVPYWAIWPFEVLLAPLHPTRCLQDIDDAQRQGLAAIMKELLVKYDNLFSTSFPYSMGWHSAPANGENNDHWQLHAHYYPPLLRSADIKKFMVGYEMLGCPQRDILPETAAELLRNQPKTHYTIKRQ